MTPEQKQEIAQLQAALANGIINKEQYETAVAAIKERNSPTETVDQPGKSGEQKDSGITLGLAGQEGDGDGPDD